MAFWRDSLFKWNEETALPFTVYQTLITSSLSRGMPVIKVFNQVSFGFRRFQGGSEGFPG